KERSARKVIVASCRSIIEGTDFIERARAMLGDSFAGVSEPIGSHSPMDAVEALVRLGFSVAADAIVAIGGSSVTDAGKSASLRVAGGTPALVMRESGVDTSG